MDRIHNDSKPYSFVLNFEDDSRAYFLTAYSESEMTGWIQAIQMARYVQRYIDLVLKIGCTTGSDNYSLLLCYYFD